jgi:surface antigen Omp85-like protein
MCRFVLATIVIAALSGPAAAQEPDTRAAELAKKQQEKAASLTTYTPNRFEKRLLAIERAGGFGITNGWFVAFGDIKTGSGFAIGPMYGKLFDNGAYLNAKAEWSLRNFKLAQVSFDGPPMANGRILAGGRVRWQDAPTLALYGLSNIGTNQRSDFSETKTEVSGRLTARPVPFVRLGAGVGYEAFETTLPVPKDPTTLDLRFIPGAGLDPNYVHSQVVGALDFRDGPGYSRHGTLLQATLHDYRQQNGSGFDFQRVDGVAEQYIPILHGNWVIYLGLRASTTNVSSGNSIPFLMLPDIGGRDLRGYANYRFRDRHSLLFTAEYRWYVQEFVDFAIFYDAGRVAARRSDLDFNDLKSSVGAGVRFHGPQTTAFRLEIARSREATRLIFAFSPVGGR